MKVFVSGSISIKTLPHIAQEKLQNIMTNNLTVIIGDAGGTDSLVQQFLFENQYKNVIVYFAGNTLRNNIGNWMVENVPAMGLEGRAKFTLKDIRMAVDSDYGLMIWDGKSKGTKRNIQEMISLNKHFYVVQNGNLFTDKDFTSKKINQQALFNF